MTSRYSCICRLRASVICIAFVSAQVVPYDPHLLAKPDMDSDMLLVIDQSKSLGGSAISKALQTVDQHHADRERGLQVSSCLGCDKMVDFLAHHQLGKDDLPMAFLFPQKSEETRRGIFRMSLKGVENPLQKLNRFVEAFDNDELTAYTRSAPVPTSKQQQGPVRIVVGSTYDKEIGDATKHTLFLVYFDQDAASKQWQSIFEQIGRKLDHKKSPLQVAKFDHAANDFPSDVNVDVSNVPRVILFRIDDSGDPDYYPEDAPRTLPSVLDWLGQMLPERNYGLDSFFAKLSKKTREDSVEI